MILLKTINRQMIPYIAILFVFVFLFSYCLFSFLLLFLILGHIWRYSGFTPGSALKAYSWPCSGDHMGSWGSNWVAVCKANTFPALLLFRPLFVHIFKKTIIWGQSDGTLARCLPCMQPTWDGPGFNPCHFLWYPEPARSNF